MNQLLPFASQIHYYPQKRKGKMLSNADYFCSRLSSCGIVRRVPVSVEEPHGIGFHRVSILIAMPAVVSMSPVLDIKHCMPKARLPESRVLGLWLCHAEKQHQGNI